MGSHYGLLMVFGDFSTQFAGFLNEIGFNNARPATDESGVAPPLSKADDYYLWTSTYKGWTFLFGQFDFNIFPDCTVEMLAQKFPNWIIYYGVEGTSGAKFFQEFKEGKLLRGYAEVEGKILEERCKGVGPPKNEYNQVDDWDLLEFALPPELSIEELSTQNPSLYRFETRTENKAAVKIDSKQTWWKFWR